jgi:hypothetical protein
MALERGEWGGQNGAKMVVVGAVLSEIWRGF